MEREIKFRGKRLGNGEWVYGDLLQGLEDDKYIVISHDEGVTKYEVDPDTVGQFTGLHDKNGKEIYEGDIVNIHEIPFELNHIGKVIFNEQIASFKVHIEENGRTYRMSFISSDTYNDGYCSVDIKYDFEVIGNIHEKL